jgi:hypothetical protein
MVMVEFVTPRSVAPVALPLPQGESMVPNFVVVPVAVPLAGAEDVDEELFPRPPLLHADITTAVATAIPTKPSERLLTTGPPDPYLRARQTVPQLRPDEERFFFRDRLVTIRAGFGLTTRQTKIAAI